MAFELNFKALASPFHSVVDKILQAMQSLTENDFDRCIVRFNDGLRPSGKNLSMNEMESARFLMKALSRKRWYSAFNLKVLDQLVDCIKESTSCRQNLTAELDEYRREHLTSIMNTMVPDLADLLSIAPLKGVNLALIYDSIPTLGMVEEAREYLIEIGIPGVEGLKFEFGCFVVFFTITYPQDYLGGLCKKFSSGHHRQRLRQCGIHRVFLVGHWSVEIQDGTVSQCKEVSYQKTEYNLLNFSNYPVSTYFEKCIWITQS